MENQPVLIGLYEKSAEKMVPYYLILPLSDDCNVSAFTSSELTQSGNLCTEADLSKYCY